MLKLLIMQRKNMTNPTPQIERFIEDQQSTMMGKEIVSHTAMAIRKTEPRRCLQSKMRTKT